MRRAGILGNYVDQFDIFLPIIALAPAAASLYGTQNMATNAGLIFVATLIGRPLGAAIFGPVADQIGRTTTTKITMAGVAITTLLVALVPGQALLGPGSLLSILTLRFLSGVFIGGGYTSAVPLAMEWTVPRRRGLVSGLIMWMSPWANASITMLVLVLLGVLGTDKYSLRSSGEHAALDWARAVTNRSEGPRLLCARIAERGSARSGERGLGHGGRRAYHR